MKHVQVRNETTGANLGRKVGLADSWWPRLRGLLGRPALDNGEGLLLAPCRSVHMFGMAFPIDVAFLDEHGEVVALYPDLSPGRRTSWHRRARYALELPAGTLAATRTTMGHTLRWSAANGGLQHGHASIEEEVLS